MDDILNEIQKLHKHSEIKGGRLFLYNTIKGEIVEEILKIWGDNSISIQNLIGTLNISTKLPVIVGRGKKAKGLHIFKNYSKKKARQIFRKIYKLSNENINSL